MATRERRVVLEYEFKGYSDPDELDAFLVDCTVTYNGAGQNLSGRLADVRESLEDAGFEQQELIQPVKTHKSGRYNPTWREVWVKQEEVHIPMMWLSPEAEKAQQEAAGRMRGWWPWLSRTQALAIVQRPRQGGRRQQKAFADWMRERLPGFKFNSKRDWWEADLADLAQAYEVLQPDGVNVSDGVRSYLGEWERDRALPVDHPRGQAVLFKS